MGQRVNESMGSTKKKRMYAVAVIGVLIVLIAALKFILGSDWAYVASVDEEGKRIGRGQWRRIPAPDSIAPNGMSHVDDYIDRLLSSKARSTSLLIFTPDGQRGLGLSHQDGDVIFGFTVEWREEPEQEQAIRKLFKELEIAPSEDYLAGNGNVDDATRVLDYAVPGDSVVISKLCKRVLRHICGIRDEEALDFTYEEDR